MSVEKRALFAIETNHSDIKTQNRAKTLGVNKYLIFLFIFFNSKSKWNTAKGLVADRKLKASVAMAIAGGEFASKGSNEVFNTNVLPGSHKAEAVSQDRA